MIGSRIRRLREARDITQLEFAFKMGISQGTLCRVEQGKRTPSVKLVLRACSLLQVSPDTILAGELERPNDGPAA